MPTIVLARQVTPNPLGQEHYQTRVIEALQLRRPQTWDFVDLPLRSFRSTLRGARRLPPRISALPSPAWHFLGKTLYGNPALVHRFDIRLPPGRRDVVTILDAAPLRFDDEGKVDDRVLRSVRRAAGAICCSEFAAAEAKEVFGIDRTWVAQAGVDDIFFDAVPLAVPELLALGIRSRFVLHAGGATKRKNLAGLADAWRIVRTSEPDLQLVLCGPAHPRRTELFADLPGIVLAGRLPGHILPRLMAAADVVVLPSTYEGFGLPALEAMACGTPVVASARSSLPEVLGDAGLVVEPEAEPIAAALRRVLGDVTLASKLSERGRARAREFTWTKSGEAHVAAYKEVLGFE